MAHVILDDLAIEAELEKLPGWSRVGNSIQREYPFSTHERAIAFIVECTPAISRENHHPTWKNRYDKVWATYNTHDAGNVITDKDFRGARILEGIFQKGYSK